MGIRLEFPGVTLKALRMGEVQGFCSVCGPGFEMAFSFAY